VRDVERSRLRALVAADLPAATRLHAEDFQLINPLGDVLSRDAYLGLIASGELSYQVWEPGHIEVRLYGDDAAVLRYGSVVQGAWDEEPFAGRFWHTDTYERRASGWQVVWSHVTAASET
jgi:hypothetical protein